MFKKKETKKGSSRKSLYRKLSLILTLIILVSFFLPWFYVKDKQPIYSLSRLLPNNQKNYYRAIRGFQVPIIAYSVDPYFVIKIAKIINPKMRRIKEKSLALFLIPAAAMLLYLFARFLAKWRLFSLLAILFSLSGCGFVLYLIWKAGLERALIHIRVGYGLWIVFWTFFVYMIISFIHLNYLSIKIQRLKKYKKNK